MTGFDIGLERVLNTTPADRVSAVRVEGLTKHYGRRVAVDGISIDLPCGVVSGFIGPNGAGKTTTMAMLLGLVAPTAGTGTVLGEPLDDPAAYLDRVGALVEGPALWPGLTGTENLRTLATLGGHDVGRIPQLLEVVGLSDRASDRYGGYSFGMKQRLGIAAALLGDPELLVLDEPTNGLDPSGIHEMRQLIAEIAREDRTVLVSSHILVEIEQVCDWLIIIDQGALVYQGSAQRFLETATPMIALVPEHLGDLDRLAALATSEGLDAHSEGDELSVPVEGDDPRAVAVALNRAAIAAGLVLAELTVRRPTLESHYLNLVEGNDR
jgi:ABC-2 type transport system ATP-binding protein